jgi:hypothetical protein
MRSVKELKKAAKKKCESVVKKADQQLSNLEELLRQLRRDNAIART